MLQVPELEKRSGDSRLYEFDFARMPELLDGETLASATFTVTPAGLTLLGSSIDGSRAQTRISGGTSGSKYLVRCAAITSGANTIVGEGQIRVVDPTL